MQAIIRVFANENVSEFGELLITFATSFFMF